jgi:hypothetical protein
LVSADRVKAVGNCTETQLSALKNKTKELKCVPGRIRYTEEKVDVGLLPLNSLKKFLNLLNTSSNNSPIIRTSVCVALSDLFHSHLVL